MAISDKLDQERLSPGDSEPSDDNLYDLALMSRVLEAAWTAAQEHYGASASDRSAIRVSMMERIIEAIEAGGSLLSGSRMRRRDRRSPR